MCELDYAAVCRLWAAIMRQWIADARTSYVEQYYLRRFLDVDDQQLDSLLRADTSRFRRLER